MSEWWTYRLSDFALFSERVYYRLFELQNEALWPWQILAIALGLVLLVLLARPTPHARGIVPFLLGAAWLWIGWSYFWRSYATINWAAAHIAPAAALEGLLLWIAAARGPLGSRRAGGAARRVALGLFGCSVLFYPLLAPALGRSWRAAEIFGITPDPTALATLAAVALSGGRYRWTLALVPALWCAISGATLWAIGADGYFIPPLCAALALALLRQQGAATAP